MDAWSATICTHSLSNTPLQGVDLYGEMRQRLVAGFEFNARYSLGERAPSWLCGGHVSRDLGPTVEIAYNEYHNRLGIPMPYTAAYLNRVRPTGANVWLASETLTHAGNP